MTLRGARNNKGCHSGARVQRASPESITTIGSMDSGPVASGRQLPTEGASPMCNCTSGNDELQSESCAHRSPDGAQRNPGPRLPQSKIPGLRCAPSWLQPLSPLSSDLPVGRFVDRAVEAFFGFSEKYFCSHLPQITFTTPAIPSH